MMGRGEKTLFVILLVVGLLTVLFVAGSVFISDHTPMVKLFGVSILVVGLLIFYFQLNYIYKTRLEFHRTNEKFRQDMQRIQDLKKLGETDPDRAIELLLKRAGQEVGDRMTVAEQH